MRAIKGLKALVHDAVDATTDLVGEGHASTARTTMRVLMMVPPLALPARAVDTLRHHTTRTVLDTVKGVNRAVETMTNDGVDLVGLPERDLPAVPLRSDAMFGPAWVGDALLGALNGVLGDHLHRRDNGLDMGMVLRPVGEPTARLVVLVHGLATTEWSWSLYADRYLGDPAASFGTLLQRDLGLSPVFLRYNTGRALVENGVAFALRLQALVDAWPLPVQEIVLVGHSMGGLVARSATLAAREAGLPWLSLLSRVICIGSPHQGAPLARLGRVVTQTLAGIDLPGTRIPAAILSARSAGIQDLHDGDLGDEVPLVEGIAYAFLAGTLTEDPAHPATGLFGDLIVPVDSAHGPPGEHPGVFVHTARFPGVRHHELQVHPAVYAQVRAFCAGELDPPD